jgi:hypothetical protein
VSVGVAGVKELTLDDDFDQRADVQVTSTGAPPI